MRFRIVQNSLGQFQVQRKAIFRRWVPAIYKLDEDMQQAVWHNTLQEARKAYEQEYEIPRKQTELKVVEWWER